VIMMAVDLESDIRALAADLDKKANRRLRDVASSSWWNEKLMAAAMANPQFKTQLFRFVDVYPATTNADDVLRHLDEYLLPADPPRSVGAALRAAGTLPLGDHFAAFSARHGIMRMAHQFIAGADPSHAVRELERSWKRGVAFTVDVLGEKTVNNDDANRYAARVDELLRVIVERAAPWRENAKLERDDIGVIPRVNISVKPTALSPHYTALTRQTGIDETAERLRPILRRARDAGALVNFDMEHAEVKDVTLELFRGLLEEDEFSSLNAGIAMQAYLKETRRDLEKLIAFSAARAVPITVRLVKGAYWDTETVLAKAAHWPIPVFEDKAESDASFEECTRLLHDHHGEVRAAFGSHNLRSIAHAIVSARARDIPDDAYEFQMLYGMAEPIHEAVRSSGFRLRIYAPVGELVPGMAYLVRRLLENTANESFVRARLSSRAPLSELLVTPPQQLSGPPPPASRSRTDARAPSAYLPDPPAEWHRAPVREAFAAALERRRARLGAYVPARIGPEERMSDDTISSVDPALPSRLVARSAAASVRDAEEAIEVAKAAWHAWRDVPPGSRAQVLFDAAQWMRERRFDIAALEVFEAAKPWAEADADVCEAIDYCEYYGRQMLRLARGGEVESPPGEENALEFAARGVGVVIAPWNFPLAIPIGMTVAALVGGNTVVLKPAEQTPATAAIIPAALAAAGLPDGVLSFLPGTGEVVGAHLVAHPDVAFVAFTGSKAVGLQIIEQAAITRPGQRQVKRVVAEMGGKNALIVDTDADLDQAVPIAVQSAFSYSGQKCSACSRVVVVGGRADEFVGRLAGAAAKLLIGAPEEMSTEMGPLIDEDAYKRVASWQERAADFGEVVLSRRDVPDYGYFVGPTIVDHVEIGSALWTDEIFGPVLAVCRAKDFDEAIELANDTEYALTAGIVSRSPSHALLAARRLRAGNVYINRTITGAVVGRHPFGGFGMSGVGSKAGSADYLLEFLIPRTISENTLRQGFAPESV
jgi:RHH-type transcriptional regulator, proline utilization regulon repressor / proline dehydrogenase / delta 1-pyrroline-5-carboxylate dehydrogenase